MKVYVYKWADLDTHILDVSKKAGTLQSKIHSIAVSILSHWANNPKDGKDAAVKMTALQVASPYHQKAFADWVSLKTGMHWAKDTETWYVQKGQKFRKDALDAAKEEPFWKVSPPTAPSPFTDEMVVKMLQGILDKQARHGKKPVEGDAFSTKGNEAIRAAMKALSD